ncbi:hypothetical protein [Algoriphagus mannitolivorans]|uniref:hypothetical protein n=1 Tax=Algoriphagus mannitolivorans TaxID=226504 RepID=UPI0004057552|nr:hypothetical protein [Algoriphagus mannitolivorans]
MNLFFQPLVSWPFFTGILFLLTLAAGFPIFFQWKRGKSFKRIAVRIILSLLFLLAFSMAVLRPARSSTGTEEGILVYGSGVERDELNFWKDSLQLRKAVALKDFDQGSEKVYLLGDQFEREELYPLKGTEFTWILPERNGMLSEVSWKGFLRKGEMQRLSYKVFSESSQKSLAIEGIDETETTLSQGWNTGKMEFQVAGLGRIEFPLIMDSDTLAWLRFYVGPSKPKKYHFISGFPNPELRNLSQWLKNKGEKVTEEIQVSRDTQLQSAESSDSLQVIFLEAGQLGRKDVQNLVKNSEVALVVWNLSNAPETIQLVNRLYGTDFELEKTSQESSRVLENGAEALPYSFLEKPAQKILLQDSWAIQFPFGNPIAIALVETSFPLFLQGNELAYEKLWSEVISQLEPEEEKSWRFEAPVLAEIGQELELYQQDSLPSELILLGDTLFLNSNPVNLFLAKGKIPFKDSGWIQVGYDLDIYAYSADEFPTLFSSEYVREMEDATSSLNSPQKESQQTISPWIWLAGMLLSLGMLWLEPKLDF